MTFDIEEWYHANYSGFDYRNLSNPEKRLPGLLDDLLDLLGSTGSRATFFVLGEVAEDIRSQILRAVKEGHELASHSMSHRLLSGLAADQLQDELRGSRMLLEDISGERVLGFRAPCFSLGKHQDYYFDVLRSAGYEYDSSFMVGRFDKSRAHSANVSVYPVSALSLGTIDIPLSGGYFRFLPLFLLKSLILATNGSLPNLYFHPRDIDSATPRLPHAGFYDLIHRYGTKVGRIKLEKLMDSFLFESIDQNRS